MLKEVRNYVCKDRSNRTRTSSTSKWNILLINLPRTHEEHMEATSHSPGEYRVYFFFVAMETVYSLGGRGLLCTLEMEILLLSLTIENANTFRSRMSLKHSGIWINHQPVFAVSCCLVFFFSYLKSGLTLAISSNNADKQHSHIVQRQ